MADGTYQDSVYRKQGGDELVIASGGVLNIETGAVVQANGTQVSNIADVAITYTSNDPGITPNGAVTIADGSTPTVDELLELCEELLANQSAIISALESLGLAASS